MSGESDNIIVRMWVSCLVQHTDGLYTGPLSTPSSLFFLLISYLTVYPKNSKGWITAGNAQSIQAKCKFDVS